MQKLFGPSRLPRSLKGVSTVEAALAMPVIIVSCLMLIDLCRYGLAQMLLGYAAFVAADTATKSTMEVDTSDCVNHLDKCEKYLETFTDIGDTGLKIARLVIGPSTSNQMIRLRSFEHFFGNAHLPLRAVYPNIGNGRLLRDLAVIRPGEKVRRDSDMSEINHSSWPYGTNDGAASGWPRSVNTWAQVLDSNPIQIRLEADFRFITPLLPAVTIEATQEGWRRTRAFGVPIAPAPPATLPIYPSATPILPTPTTDPEAPPPTATTTRTAIPTVSDFCRNHCFPGDCNPAACLPAPPAGCGGCRNSRGD